MTALKIFHLNNCVGFLALFLILSAPIAVNADTYNLKTSNAPESYFLVATDTAGLLGFMGHRHAILAGDWEVELTLEWQNLVDSSINLTIDTGSLVLDSERAYRLAGFGTSIPPEDARRATMERIRGPGLLNVADNPSMTFRSSQVEVESAEADGTILLAVKGTLRLRADLPPPGPVEVKVTLEPATNRIAIAGTTVIRQSEFGLEPFSIAGVMRVRDEIRMEWYLELPGEISGNWR